MGQLVTSICVDRAGRVGRGIKVKESVLGLDGKDAGANGRKVVSFRDYIT